jgi:hypothetical protein
MEDLGTYSIGEGNTLSIKSIDRSRKREREKIAGVVALKHWQDEDR